MRSSPACEGLMDSARNRLFVIFYHMAIVLQLACVFLVWFSHLKTYLAVATLYQACRVV